MSLNARPKILRLFDREGSQGIINVFDCQRQFSPKARFLPEVMRSVILLQVIQVGSMMPHTEVILLDMT